MAQLTLDPVTRIEGHLRIDTRVADGAVAEAWSRGEMFRGFEALLAGRDAFDAPVITQRICGVCPVSHAVASCRALEDALGIAVPDNGRLLRNLVLGANYLQSHVLHFYQLSALDYVDVAAVASYEGPDPVLRELRTWVRGELSSNRVLPASPLLPRIPAAYPEDPTWNAGALAHYAQALEVRQEAHAMAALFGGKMPHTAALVPGGVTTGVDPATVEDFRNRLRRVLRFVENAYLPDVAAMVRRFPAYARMGRGTARFLSYGVFDEDGGPWLPAGTSEGGAYQALDTDAIAEEPGASRYEGSSRHPREGETRPAPHRAESYSWIKAPRYGGRAFEVGPLARMEVARSAGAREVGAALSAVLSDLGLPEASLPSVAGRHAARAAEAVLLARRMESWLDALAPGEPSVAAAPPSGRGRGQGLTEAPRGSLGHWVSLEGRTITRYQCLVPSTWNFSPRGDRGDPGPVEAALEGTPVDPSQGGIEVARVVRSFDPCIACAVH